ncbi:kinase-like protein [Didymella exigua CBS 183.55]|uniref:Kinase-like protein n=1 Tax=Didymella exigua CBS 183.55 TaxID=1150837 RepID=A0A6A5RAY5_9PLEO|nr:kinase-like protein [Didymella exigua CBS 183.55]KAF1925391.1 kinase-like protein [Didymella exigua CBS 183.55]
MPETCRTAKEKVEDLQIEQDPKSFFPLDGLRSYFKEQKVREILLCACSQCREDARMFNSRIARENYVDMIMGGSEPKDLTKTYYSVFGLLVFVEHPLFIIGFLENRCNDYILESWVTRSIDFSRERLRTLTGDYQQRSAAGFDRFVRRFTSSLSKFSVPHLGPDGFSLYREKAVFPFIEEKQIGQRRDENGQLTSEGANGKVFAFRIQREYNRFPHSSSRTEYVRKRIETSQPKQYLEHSNIDYVQQFADNHIVKLVKAYGHGDSVNLIFPRAWTNLDHLLRDRNFGYSDKRDARLELADAWKQLLGISRALKKIHGFGNGRSNGTVDEQLCIHFDLKPDNILIERENGNWLITDFGQSALTKRRRGTTPRIGGHFGTDAYAPPEIDDVNMEFGRAYDIWSLGCIMLEVTAFMVLGPAGLTGSGSFVGLDQARRAMPHWARNSNERFFYQEVPSGAYMVKKDIQTFMVNLESSHGRYANSEESKAFLNKILGLINRMLKPKVADRVGISMVVDILSSALRRASAGAIEQRPHQIISEAGEHVLGEPDLSKIELWHWSAANREWEECRLAILKSEANFMRLHCWGQGHVPQDVNLPHSSVKMLPLYAFWDPARFRDSNAWLDLLVMSTERCSVVPNAKFAFNGDSGLDDARQVQSILTSQHIVGSFPLSQVKLTRASSAVAALNRVYRKIRPTSGNAPAEASSKMFTMTSATVQIWAEQQDAVLRQSMRREFRGTQESAAGRPVRGFDGARPRNSPRRLCIYLHEPRFICTIRIDVNWVLESDSSDVKLYLKPRSSAGAKAIYASWLRPTLEERAAGHPAGIPLDPKVLRYHEDSDSIELEDVELTFLSSNVLDTFRSVYDDTKEAWAIERSEREDRTEVNSKPEGTLRVPDGTVRLPDSRNRVSIFARTIEREDLQSASSASTSGSRHDSTLENRMGPLQNPDYLVVPPPN